MWRSPPSSTTGRWQAAASSRFNDAVVGNTGNPAAMADFRSIDTADFRSVDADDLAPSKIEHRCEELFEGETLVQKYNYIVYHFDCAAATTGRGPTPTKSPPFPYMDRLMDARP